MLNIADPLERVIVAGRTGFPLSEADLSSLVMEAVACQPGDEWRAAVSLLRYQKLRAGVSVRACPDKRPLRRRGFRSGAWSPSSNVRSGTGWGT